MDRIGRAVAVVVLVSAAGCSSTTPSGSTGPAVTVPGTASTAPGAPGAFTEASGLVYASIDGAELSMDVFAPTGAGPWPVVVSFHGRSSAGKDFVETVALAEAAAQRGMVVFAPTWLEADPFPATGDSFRRWDDTVSCAVAFAQQHAPDFGGDPSVTVVEGFSAGAGAALLFASQPARTGSVPGCAADTGPGAVRGYVLGDADTWLHASNFDPSFETESAAIAARLEALIDPGSWTAAPTTDFVLWVGVDGGGAREIGDPDDPSGWFARRDPDGTIRSDLESLDELADGKVGYLDAARLLELRLTRAGFPARVDRYAGGHTMLDKLPEIVATLADVADVADVAG